MYCLGRWTLGKPCTLSFVVSQEAGVTAWLWIWGSLSFVNAKPWPRAFGKLGILNRSAWADREEEA